MEAVNKLSATEKTNHMFLLSWDAPYSLPGVLILYRVSISGDNGETVTVKNVTELCYPSPGHNFTVTVVAVNTAGVSPPRSINVTVDLSSTSFPCKYQSYMYV